MLLKTQGVTGVFVGAHAIADGVLTRRQLADGPFLRVLQGVYADVSQPRDHLLRCRAAALLMPDGAALGGRSAAAVLGAPSPGYGDPVTVVVPGPTAWRGPAGVRVHQTALPPSDVADDGYGMRWTTARRTAWEVGALETTATAVGVLDAMLRTDLLHEGDLGAILRERAGTRWSRRARRAFELVDRRSASPPESWVRVACALAGLPAPVLQFDVVEDGAWLGTVDLAWPEARLIVEYEGEYHFDELQIARDDVRLSRIAAAGWRVIRLAAHDLRSMDALVARIRAALAEAGFKAP
ncbi:endonuclease domain-containing protein [Trujillonella endophytica]|uniref:DUF559 domain-containing protein n=1 Tax=Trujillonella endophytica TaxID=673521 RepID=A0A1H8U1N0_9ACTN|nr:DUF559 domain-containing protein [Trujillella endophytica]SEO97172.1 Protein of unknown function [Trujillella endophytica]